MRDFLESDVDFTWPSGLGKTSGTHCDLKMDIKGIPLLWKKKISDKKASIDLYEAHPDYPYEFKKSFVVKTIRESSSKKARDEAANEVNTMRDLRHPHITALLATFMYQERLSILIFPAACCDLHQFMKQISKDIQSIHSPVNHPDRLDGHKLTLARSNSTTETDSTASVAHSHQGPDCNINEKRSKGHHSIKPQAWPLKAPFQHKLDCLRRYFICLSEALKYLHESDVRHKDIKPENILIDESGAVILTDFGISRRFAKHTSHVTNNEWKFTRKYASPEIMKGKRVERDDPSDVFSLGCVFLEMATLLLGRDLDNLAAHYATTVNQTGLEEAYHCNLDKVYTWIDFLRTRGTRTDQEQPHQAESILSQDYAPDPEQSVTESLIQVRKMLDEDPKMRPKSRDLWSCFRSINPEKCRDCDPRLEERWKPSIKQRQNAKAGLNRRSMISEVDVIPETTEPLPFEGIDGRLLSPPHSGPQSRRVSSHNMGLNDIPRYEYSDRSSRPSSPKYQPRVDDQATNIRASRASSPTINGVQQGEKTTWHHEQTSGSPLLTGRLQDSDPGALRHMSAKVDSPPLVPPFRTTSPQILTETTNVQRIASVAPNPNRNPPTAQESSSTKSTNRTDIALTAAQDTPSLNSQIIVYNFEQRRAYQWPSSALDGSYISFLAKGL
jgi:serine/threonine protein kinase